MSDNEIFTVAVVGSRDFGNLQLVRDYVHNLPASWRIVSGGAIGVDQAAAAASWPRPLIIHGAKWELYGRIAGLASNTLIVNDADMMVAFWNGTSKGTAHAIELAALVCIPVIVIDEFGRSYLPDEKI